jgi:hypothetical protein
LSQSLKRLRWAPRLHCLVHGLFASPFFEDMKTPDLRGYSTSIDDSKNNSTKVRRIKVERADWKEPSRAPSTRPACPRRRGGPACNRSDLLP